MPELETSPTTSPAAAHPTPPDSSDPNPLLPTPTPTVSIAGYFGALDAVARVPVPITAAERRKLVRALTKRFGGAFAPHAEAIAMVVADPAGLRAKLRVDAFERWPLPQSGRSLLVIRTVMYPWGALVHGGNGRSRNSQFLASTPGVPTPWSEPVLDPNAPATHGGMLFRVPTFDGAADASAASASAIWHTKLAAGASEHGIWNPVVVAPARFETPSDGHRHAVVVLDGNTRVAVAQKALHAILPTATRTYSGAMCPERPRHLVGVSGWAQEACGRALRVPEPATDVWCSVADLLMASHRIPTAAPIFAAARLAVIPAVIALAVVDADGAPVDDPGAFVAATSALVRATHTETRAWEPSAQTAMLGEAVVGALRDADIIDTFLAEQVCGQPVTAPMTPDLAVGTLIRAVTHPASRDVLRTVLEESTSNDPLVELSRVQTRLQCIAPIIERIYRADPQRRDTATAALTGEYLNGHHARRASWLITGRTAAELYADASQALEDDPTCAEVPSDAAMEMLVRYGITAIVRGMILADQGSQFTRAGDPRRGKVAKVLKAMATSPWGLQTLRDVGVALETQAPVLPPMRDPSGTILTELVAGSAVNRHYVAMRGEANRHVRTVLFGTHNQPEPAPASETPEQAAIRLITVAATHIATARDSFDSATLLTDGAIAILQPGWGVNPDLAATMTEDLARLQQLVARHAEDNPAPECTITDDPEAVSRDVVGYEPAVEDLPGYGVGLA